MFQILFIRLCKSDLDKYYQIWSRRKFFISIPRTDLLLKLALVLGDINVLDFIHNTL